MGYNYRVLDDEAQIDIDVEPDLAGRIVVRVHGALDLPEVGDLRTILARVCDGDCPDVVVDLEDVTFIGSSGMGLLLQTSNELADSGRSMVLRGAAPSIRRAFAITHLDQVLTFEDVGEPATDAVSSGTPPAVGTST